MNSQRGERNMINGTMGKARLAVTLAVAACLVGRMGLSGAAIGMLAGAVVDSAVRCTAFLRLTTFARRPVEAA